MPQLWSAPVRFAECDQQGVVFNAHHLVWADEALNAWWTSRGLPWAGLVQRGIEYKLGRTSLTLRFGIRVGDRRCCVVRTTYVLTEGGAPTPWPDDVRAMITGP